MARAGGEVVLVGPLSGEGFTAGLDTPQAVARIPRRFTGYVWTNTVDTTGPLIRRRRDGP
jgi:glycerophosphoryl diester phosphodiesterase